MAAIAAIVTSCSSGRQSSHEIAPSADRNVLVITIDTLRADALGFAGGPARTPNIDALAVSGVRFTFAHAHAVLTLPSHATILTGRYPFEHGVRENSGFRVKPGTETIATRLKAAGFATGAFVAAFPLDARFGLADGFDVYDGRFDASAFGAEFSIPERRAPIVVSHANAWIARQSERWFAWVHLYEPHAPYRPPPPFDREYAAQPYYGEVAAADAALGPLLDTARGSPRPTLVILTGDHGEGLGEHGEATHGLFAYESTPRVPLIISEVRSTPSPDGGETSDAPARHVDVVPTILDALGLPVPAGLPGHSLRMSADRATARERVSYFEAMSGAIDYGWAPLDGVLADREKYINLPIPELYDIASDEHETRNLLPTASDRGRVLLARLSAFRATRPGPQRPESAEVARGLQALGYVSGGGRSPSARDAPEQDDPKRLVDIDRLMQDAAAKGEAGQLQESIAEFRRVLERRPDMMAASRHLAFAYWRSGNAAAAIDALRAALRTDGADTGAAIQLGTYLMDTGRLDEAIAMLKTAAVESDGSDLSIDALDALGIAYGRAGRTADALTAFDRALAIDPGNAVTYENVGAVQLDASRLSDAQRAFTRAVELNPGSAHAHAGLALVANRKDDRTRAIAEWKLAVEIQPANVDALYNLGVTLARERRTAEARPYLDRFLRTAPPAQYRKEIENASRILAQDR